MGGPRFVAAGRKARLWGVPLGAFRLGPDEAGPSPALRATPLPEGGKDEASTIAIDKKASKSP